MFIADFGWDRFEDSRQRKAGVPSSHAELRAIPLDAARVNGGGA